MLINYKTEINRLDRLMPEVKNLTLTYKKLTEQDLSKCLRFFPDLECLEIANGVLEELPKEVFQYPNLIRLRIENTAIKSIPDEIGNLKKLALFSFRNSNLNYISDALYNCPLEVLDLENVNLKEIPRAILNLSNLIYLKLDKNQIKEFPSEYLDALAPKLNSLILTDNQIEYFPLICNFPNLQFLYLSKNKFRTWNDKFAGFPQLIELMLNDGLLETVEFHHAMPTINQLTLNYNQLNEFPKGLENIRYVKYFDIYGNNFTSIPEEIKYLEECEQLNFDLDRVTDAPLFAKKLNYEYKDEVDLEEGNEIPLSVFQDKTLRRLDLSGKKNPVFPDDIPANSNIYTVVMNNCNLSKIPQNLDKLKSLFYLELKNNHFTHLPKELAVFKELDCINLSGNQLESFAGYSEIKSLHSLDISNNPCVNNIEDLLEKRAIHIEGFNWKAIKMNKKIFVPFMAALAKSPLTEAEKEKLIVLAKNQKELDFPCESIEQMIQILCIPHRKLETETRKKLLKQNQKALKQNPFTESSILYIAGKTSQKKSEISKQCQKLGIELSPKLTQQVSHILLGDRPKDLLNKELAAYVFISESDLSQMHKSENPEFLDQVDEESINKIRNLLRAKVFSNVAIAVEMLKNGGVPKDLYWDILYVIKTHFSCNETKALTKLIKPLLPQELEGVLKSRARLDFADERESDIFKKLVKNEKTWGKDFCLYMSLELFKDRKRGLRYLMTKVENNHPLRLQAIELLKEEDLLNWQYCYGYQEDWWSEGERRRSLPIPFASEIVDKSEIKRLNLRRCKISKLPDEMKEFTSLKAIDLCTNGLKELPAWFEELKELEFLDLRDNYLKKFPTVLYHLPKLKKVLFGKQSIRNYSSVNDYIKPPKDLETAFSQVEFLFEDDERFYSSTQSSVENY
ncbi:MAG: leucine-rich repeat domain-containing protein [Marinifilaceae bacterium]|jgi:Leucine-rich repeat (LRR) protein|nr:leucine-rich repeat domain-containing protein [Marinifilaceae bacterium]